MKPIEILLSNLDALIDAMKNQSTKNAYKALEHIAEIRSMPYNTFKTLAPAVVRTALHVINATKPEEIETVTATKPEEIETVTATKPEETPSKYKDWYVARCNDGYIRMNRINLTNGKRESVYVGKVWDAQEVERKLNPNQMDLLSCPETTAPLPAISQNAVIQDNQVPNRYKEWYVARGTDGYIRMNKELNGKRISVYIGKHWSEEIAEAKLAKYAL